MAKLNHGGAFADHVLATAEPAFRTHLGLPELKREHGGNVFAWARQTGLDPRRIIDLSASINPLGPPPSARKAFFESFRMISCYPDGEGRELKAVLARHHGVKTAEVLLGNGSTQLIYLLCRALKPRKALVVRPAFSEYGNALELGGTEIQSYFLLPQYEFKLPLQDFLQGCVRSLGMIFLSNPNSATGQIISNRWMTEIARVCSQKKIFLVVDEAFMDFAEGESIKDLIRENPYLVVLRSLTKYYSLPGLRIGYLLAQSRTVDLLRLHQEPWSVNGPVQKVAIACLRDKRFRLKTAQWLAQERKFLFNALAKTKGLCPSPSHANFILVRLECANSNTVDLRRFLLQRKILIRSCGTFSTLGENYFRVAVHLRSSNQLLLKGLKAYEKSVQSSYRSGESTRG